MLLLEHFRAFLYSNLQSKQCNSLPVFTSQKSYHVIFANLKLNHDYYLLKAYF